MFKNNDCDNVHHFLDKLKEAQKEKDDIYKKLGEELSLERTKIKDL